MEIPDFLVESGWFAPGQRISRSPLQNQWGLGCCSHPGNTEHSYSHFVVPHENLRDMGYEALVPARPHLGLQFVECQGPSSLFVSSGLWVSKCPWLLPIAHWAIGTWNRSLGLSLWVEHLPLEFRLLYECYDPSFAFHSLVCLCAWFSLVFLSCLFQNVSCWCWVVFFFWEINCEAYISALLHTLLSGFSVFTLPPVLVCISPVFSGLVFGRFCWLTAHWRLLSWL